jgi:hypothetical protein
MAKDIFSLFDILGSKTDLTIKGQASYKTKIGAFLSLAYIASIGYFIYYYADQYLDTTSPNINRNE